MKDRLLFLPEVQKTIKPTEVCARILRAGFDLKDIYASLKEFPEKNRHLLKQKLADRLGVLSDEALAFLNRTLPKGPLRPLFFKEIIQDSNEKEIIPDSNERVLGQFLPRVARLSEMAKTDPALECDFARFATWANNFLFTRYRIPRTPWFLVGAEVLVRPKIYQLFGRDIERVQRAVYQMLADDDLVRNPGTSLAFVSNMDKLVNSQYFSVLTDGIDDSFYAFCAHSFTLDRIFAKPERVKLVNEYFRGKRTWTERLYFLGRLFDSERLAYITDAEFERELLWRRVVEVSRKVGASPRKVFLELNGRPPAEKFKLISGLRSQTKDTQQLKEAMTYSADYRHKITKPETFTGVSPETLAKIRRREDPKNPLNRLGIAKTVGFEVEYPVNEYTMRLKKEGIFDVIEVLGFKRGGGGSPCDEISPGPFYSPETANVVFGRFVDLGIVDLYHHKALTLHFNVGLESADGLIELVRALHLTGACFYPQIEFVNQDLRDSSILDKFSDRGFYVECKTFDVIDRRGFEENMRWATYLSWALGAHQEQKKGVIDAAGFWRKRLADIWDDYIKTISTGLKSAGLSNYLFTEDNFSNDVNCAKQQLKFVFPNAVSRFGDVSEVGKGKWVYLKVEIGRRKWHNLVAFAREVTEAAVAKVEAIADEIEKIGA